MTSFHDFFGSGGQRTSRRRESKEVDTQGLYDLLGVPKDADAKAIKKAYRKKALKSHPDRGGDPEVFKKITKAYEILSDQSKRDLYDKHGEEGVEKGHAPEESPFSNIFQPGNRSRKGLQKGESGILPIQCTLEELYNGAVKKAQFNKQFFCEACGGKGGKNVRVCQECNGRGMKLVTRHLGPHMIQQMQAQCDACGGQGEICRPQDRCRRCNGAKVYKKIHTFDVHVNRGTKDEKKILFREEGDQIPDKIPGDVYVQINQLPHHRFRREGAHLFYNKKISLVEALTGFEFPIQTLDNRTLIVKSSPPTLYAPDSVRAIRDEGMPMQDDISRYGNLYVTLSVQFPETLPRMVIKDLASFLPDIERDPIDIRDPNLDQLILEDIDIEEEKEKWREEAQSRKNMKGQLDDDDDDERQQGVQTAQCQTQ